MESVNSELEALQSIFADEIKVDRFKRDGNDIITLEMKVRPSQLGQCSCASIRTKVEIGSEYPSISPVVQLCQPRGIDETNVDILKEKISKHLDENIEMPVMYDVFQLVQDFLESAQNWPSAVCPVCLNNLTRDIPSLCTHCDHFIHKYCFVNYIDYSKREMIRQLNEWPSDMKHKVDQSLRCPVCRVELTEEDFREADQDEITEQIKPAEEADWYFDWDGWRKHQQELSVIYEKQRIKGGIIDLEEERSKNLITEDTVVAILPPDQAETSSHNSDLLPVTTGAKKTTVPLGSLARDHYEDRHKRGRRRGGSNGSWYNGKDLLTTSREGFNRFEKVRGMHNREFYPRTGQKYFTNGGRLGAPISSNAENNLQFLGPPPGFSNTSVHCSSSGTSHG